MIAFPFAKGVRHYSGQSLRELESTAEGLGAVQDALSTLGSNCELPGLESARPARTIHADDGKRLEVVAALARKISFGRYAQLFLDHEKLIRAAWEETATLTLRRHELHPPLLHDAHPHNVFVQTETCVLIYDFEAVSRSVPYEDVLAFAAHRFVREHIRQNVETYGRSNQREVRAIFDLFFAAYQRSGGVVPEALPGNLGSLIKATNLPKLLSNFEYLLGSRTDEAKRAPSTHLAEARKFLAYLTEADYLSATVDNASSSWL